MPTWTNETVDSKLATITEAEVLSLFSLPAGFEIGGVDWEVLAKEVIITFVKKTVV